MGLSKDFVVIYLIGFIISVVDAQMQVGFNVEFDPQNVVPAPAPSPIAHLPNAIPTSPPSPSPSPSPSPIAPTPAEVVGVSSPGVFDVTKYGAIDDGTTESTSAFQNAWNEACKFAGNATFLIPRGTFYLEQIEFQGPCYNGKSPKVEVRGTLKAPSDLKTFKDPSWWISFRSLDGLVFTGDGTGLFDGQGEPTYAQSEHSEKVHCSLKFIKVSDATISNITLLNSKGFHMSILRSNHVFVHHVNITAPQDSPNTDGIHISDSSYVNIISSKIGVGDDCVGIERGTTNISISNVFCGPGHGISIGSLGKYPNESDVVGVHVKNCTMHNTTNGVRVKTWPGASPSNAYNITFEDIVVNNVENPIIIDQGYCPGHKCKAKPPSLVKISDVHFKNITGTSSRVSAVTLACSTGVPCENIELVDIDITYAKPGGVAISTCLNAKGIFSGKQNPDTCLL